MPKDEPSDIDKLMNMAWTTSAAAAPPPPLTLADLAAMAEALPPPPPPPDRHHCKQCGEEMSKPAMDVTAGVGVFAPVVAHLCGRCAVVAKRLYHYGPRNEEGFQR